LSDTSASPRGETAIPVVLPRCYWLSAGVAPAGTPVPVGAAPGGGGAIIRPPTPGSLSSNSGRGRIRHAVFLALTTSRLLNGCHRGRACVTGPLAPRTQGRNSRRGRDFRRAPPDRSATAPRTHPAVTAGGADAPTAAQSLPRGPVREPCPGAPSESPAQGPRPRALRTTRACGARVRTQAARNGPGVPNWKLGHALFGPMDGQRLITV